uniref:Minor capsid protein L2 n=1 Tax=Human papillomavirus 42 TaxID=10590 RepID=A0A7L8YA52_HPV42|nr:L2 [human papillomavirus 42]
MLYCVYFFCAITMPPQRSRRRKRASATQLYQTCKASGTCPPDVIPKVEGTTLADKILQWGSLGVFFGGLGIGTGAGTGGRTGYVPLGTRPPVIAEPGPAVRPPIAVDTVGPSDPSIVSLLEESSVIDAGITVPDITSHGGFNITTSTGGPASTPAILDISPPTNTIRVTTTTSTNPLYIDPFTLQPPLPAEVNGRLLISTPTITPHSYEEIPMDTFVVSTDTTNTFTSTPIPGPRSSARLGLYSRATQQRPVTTSAFLTSPARLVTYDNPAYEGLTEDTLVFEHPSIHTAPDPDFMDIVALHRPMLSSKQGSVRVSRIGQRLSMQTRRGTRFGSRVHFFHDISPITHSSETIELQPLSASSVSAASNINDGLFDIYVDTSDVNVTNTTSSIPMHGFATPRLSTTSFPTLPSMSTHSANTTIPFSFPATVHVGPDLSVVDHPWDSTPTSVMPQGNFVMVSGWDFILHPSYFWRRRRKPVPYFFADVRVAA